MEGHQVALFQLNSHQNVACAHHGKEQAPACHVRRAPKGNEESQVERMAHQAVWSGCAECWRFVVVIAQVFPYLLEPEQIKVVDQQPALFEQLS